METAVHHMSPAFVGNHTPLPSMVTVSASCPAGAAPDCEADGPMLEAADEAVGECGAAVAVLRESRVCSDGESPEVADAEERTGDVAREGDECCCCG